ncbi:unnamed protein product [Rhodiola kirilowii]
MPMHACNVRRTLIDKTNLSLWATGFTSAFNPIDRPRFALVAQTSWLADGPKLYESETQ